MKPWRATARAGTTEQRTAVRAKIILRAAEGVAKVTIAGELGVSVPTVGLWRSRIRERGLFGLVDGPRTGRPAIYGRENRERIGPDLTHGGALDRTLPMPLRIWRGGPTGPRRSSSAGPSVGPAGDRSVGRREDPDPRARSDAADAAPPARAGRTPHPRLQAQRHVTLSAALEIATGIVTTRTSAQHRAVELLAFLNLLARTYPRRQIHVVLDSVSTHKKPGIQRWLARHKRLGRGTPA